MTPAQIELLRFAYKQGKSDADIATLLSVPIADVIATKAELGLTSTTKPKTMKEAAREYLLAMSDAEKREFLATIPKKDLWQMAEGAAPTSGVLDVKQEIAVIDITPQLTKIYGQQFSPIGADASHLPNTGEESQLPAGSGE